MVGFDPATRQKNCDALLLLVPIVHIGNDSIPEQARKAQSGCAA